MSKVDVGVFDVVEIKDQVAYQEVVKQATALLAEYDKIKFTPSDDTGRLVSLARTELESSVLWALKALSRQNVK
jgi:hypothetical protein